MPMADGSFASVFRLAMGPMACKFFRRLNQCESAGDGLALRLALQQTAAAYRYTVTVDHHCKRQI